jgi:periplasmic divalent cation tolerance protein
VHAEPDEQADFVVVLTTLPDRRTARLLARHLVTDRLAACVQATAIESTYTWQSELHEEEEILLIVKTRRARYPELEEAILRHHPYETPEIVLLPIETGLPSYLAWIDKSTAPGC